MVFEAGSKFAKVVAIGMNVLGLGLLVTGSAEWQSLIPPDVTGYAVVVLNIAVAAFTKSKEYITPAE